MSEYDDGGYGVDDYGGGSVTVPAGTPVTPEVIPRVAMPQMPPAAPQAKTAGGLRGLGELTAAGRCTIRSLAQVAYRFFQEVATGTTVQSLGTLNVYRALYNTHRGSFVAGLPAAASLPASLSAAEWSVPMRQVVANLLAAALGPAHPATALLNSLPPAISGITGWFTAFRNALDPADLPVLREYLEIPIISGTAPDVSLANAVRDDLRRCGVIAAAVPPPAPPPPPPPATASTPGGQASAGGGGAARPPSSGGSVIQQSALPVASGTSGLMTVGLGALVAYGLYLAMNEKPASGGKASGLGAYKHPDLVEKAKKAAKADAKVAKCIAGAELRGTVSLDELAGPKGNTLAKALAKIDASDANAVEAVYWAELDGMKLKVCPRDT